MPETLRLFRPTYWIPHGGLSGDRERVHRLTGMEIPLDAVEVADANLDVVHLPEAGVGIELLALPEDPPHRVEGILASVRVKGMGHLDHGAVQPANEHIFLFSQRFGVFRQGEAGQIMGVKQEVVAGFEGLQRLGFEQIEAVAEVDNRPDNRFVLYLGLAAGGVLFEMAGVLEGSFGVVLPEVYAVAEPVVVVLAMLQVLVAGA